MWVQDYAVGLEVNRPKTDEIVGALRFVVPTIGRPRTLASFPFEPEFAWNGHAYG